jgi:hypothetical protein
MIVETNMIKAHLLLVDGDPVSLGEFAIRTLEEAGEPGALVAQGCPNTDAALFGITEPLVTGIEHGNPGRPDEEKSQPALSNCRESEADRRSAHPDNLGKRVGLSFRREAKRSNQIAPCIADDSHGFAWQDCLEPGPHRGCDPNGRGIALSGVLSFERVHYEGCENVAVATIAPVG